MHKWKKIANHYLMPITYLICSDIKLVEFNDIITTDLKDGEILLIPENKEFDLGVFAFSIANASLTCAHLFHTINANTLYSLNIPQHLESQFNSGELFLAKHNGLYTTGISNREGFVGTAGLKEASIVGTSTLIIFNGILQSAILGHINSQLGEIKRSLKNIENEYLYEFLSKIEVISKEIFDFWPKIKTNIDSLSNDVKSSILQKIEKYKYKIDVIIERISLEEKKYFKIEMNADEFVIYKTLLFLKFRAHLILINMSKLKAILIHLDTYKKEFNDSIARFNELKGNTLKELDDITDHIKELTYHEKHIGLKGIFTTFIGKARSTYRSIAKLEDVEQFSKTINKIVLPVTNERYIMYAKEEDKLYFGS